MGDPYPPSPPPLLATAWSSYKLIQFREKGGYRRRGKSVVYKTAPELSDIEEGRCLRVLGAPCGWRKMLVRVLAPAVAQIQDLGIDGPLWKLYPSHLKIKMLPMAQYPKAFWLAPLFCFLFMISL